MNKHDLLETGMRLIGVWISASGILTVLTVAIQAVEHGALPANPLLLVPIELLLGLCLLFLSPGFVHWMRAKDERVEEQATIGVRASQEIF